MPLYIGIDGGGTKTACVLGDDSAVLANSRSSGSNVIRLGEKQAGAALREAISKACASAGVSPLNIHAVCVGASGAGQTAVQETLKGLIGRIVPRSFVHVIGDNEIALEAALQQLPGIVVIAGTGSIAYGRNERGERARAGGWGPIVSDEGSGQWIGREAVASALRTGDPYFLDAVMQHWSLESKEQLIQYVNQSPTPDFSSLPPLVIVAAERKNVTARAVLSDAGKHLAAIAEAVLEKLWPRGAIVRVGMAGGILASSADVRFAFFAKLREKRPTAAISFRIADPAMGALSIARRM
jgi:N-acetylglucosamine kinase-like BadF-type ATPase